MISGQVLNRVKKHLPVVSSGFHIIKVEVLENGMEIANLCFVMTSMAMI